MKQADLSSFKWLMYGAAPMGDVLLRRAMDMLRCEFIQAYGMTETSGSVVFAEVLPRNASGKLLKRELRLTHAGPAA